MWACNNYNFISYPLHQKGLHLKNTPTMKEQIDCDVQSKHLYAVPCQFFKTNFASASDKIRPSFQYNWAFVSSHHMIFLLSYCI